MAQDRSKVNDGIVVFSGILEDIWENWLLVHLPSVFKVNLTNQGGESPFCQTPFSLVNPDRDNKKKRKRISCGEVVGRV